MRVVGKRAMSATHKSFRHRSYDVGGRTFHSPVSEQQLGKYEYLRVKDIDQLRTEGKEIGELVSTQFVNKVISLIESGNYRYDNEEDSLNEEAACCEAKRVVRKAVL